MKKSQVVSLLPYYSLNWELVAKELKFHLRIRNLLILILAVSLMWSLIV